jgi:hypothetical protein
VLLLLPPLLHAVRTSAPAHSATSPARVLRMENLI